MSFTSSPPRRDLYELEQSITTVQTKSAAEQGGFLVPETDPTPQEQASVTTGWTPAPDHEAAWQEKWNLTR